MEYWHCIPLRLAAWATGLQVLPGTKEKSPGEDTGLGDRGAAKQPALCPVACEGVRGFLGCTGC